MKNNIYTLSFIAYIIVLSLLLASTFSYNYMFSDEGTHLLLSIFYKDLISNLPSLGFSYQNAYDYSIDYLVHYPKLQIAYPPLYHLTNASVFSLTGPSLFVARAVNLIFFNLTLVVFYILIKKYFTEKISFLTTLIFSLSFYSLFYASRAFQDFISFFFFLSSILVFSKAMETKKIKYFLLLSATSALSILGKQTSWILVIFFIFYIIYKNGIKTGTKQLIPFILFLIILLTPYMLILKSVGGFEINKIVAIGYAGQQGEPTSVLDPNFWLYFLIQPTYVAPFTILFVAVLAIYIYKKEKYWKEFLIFFLVFYISLSLIPNKEVRFSQLYLLPAYIAASVYLARLKNRLLIPAFLIVYILVSAAIFYPTLKPYPQQQLAEHLYSDTPSGASIAFFSDDEPAYSSAIMATLLHLDKNRTAVTIRSCVFGNKTKEDILKVLDEANTYFLVYSSWSKEKSIELIKGNIEKSFSVAENNLTTDVYIYKNFQNKKPEKPCNYICLTGEKICERT